MVKKVRIPVDWVNVLRRKIQGWIGRMTAVGASVSKLPENNVATLSGFDIFRAPFLQK
jgi:hypothetical protein